MSSVDPLTSVADVSLGVRGRVFNWLLRIFVKRRLRSMSTQDSAIISMRQQVERLARKLSRYKDNLQIDDQYNVAGVPCEHLARADANDTIILYLHGGAFFCCSPRTHWGITRTLAQHTQAQVICPDYRLIPEHPFPAALNDALAVYRQLLADTPARKIVVAGDSAGGNLVLAMLHAAQSEQLPMPSSVVCLSPLTDLTGSGDSVRNNIAKDAMLPGERMHELARMYLHGAYARQPTASPLFGDFSGFPPMLFHVGDTEILFDDTARCVDKARAASVEAHMRIWPKLPHVFHAFSSHLPVARVALEEIADFIQAKLRQP